MMQKKKTARREMRRAQQNGLDDLPGEIALVIEENAARKLHQCHNQRNQTMLPRKI